MAELHNQMPDQSVTSSTAATTSAEPANDVSSLTTSSPAKSSKPRHPSIHEIYKQPAPLRTFPFPTLTNNPLSLVHLAATWLRQFLSPPPAEPSVVHTAYWDHATRTISVTDEKSMEALWQQGFYGKGNLSRSEPNWLKREKIRQGVAQGKVSEANTEKRREDRVRAKWERARLEQEALERQRLEESRLLAAAAVVEQPAAPAVLRLLPPVGPLELLALPNSHVELAASGRASRSEEGFDESGHSVNGSGSSGNDDAESNTTVSSDPAELKRRKSVRFSPNVESTVFQHTDPPSPPRSVSSSSLKPETVLAPNGAPTLETNSALSAPETGPKAAAEALATIETTVINKEHLQLAPEEAFFLTFALGALKVIDTATQAVIPTLDLFTLLRQHSYFPPRMPEALQPDDPFLVNYVVYHHFRSLGWVPRPGVKFGVDCRYSLFFSTQSQPLIRNRAPLHARPGL